MTAITLEIIEGPDYRRDDDGWEHNAYTVRLRRGTRSLTTPYMMGLGHGMTPPQAEDVLASLMLDASGYDNADGSEDWAENYGWNADSRKAERIYHQVGTLTRKLRRFLGDDYDATATEDAEDAARRLVNA